MTGTGGSDGPVEAQDLEELLVEVLGSVFGEEALPAWDEPVGEAPHAVSRIGISAGGGRSPTNDTGVRDTGVGDTEVEVRVGSQLARVLAGRMFGVANPSDDDLLDAIGELGNIVGGNVKTLLHAHARLSLPSSRLDGTGSDGPGEGGLRVSAVVLGQVAELLVRPGRSLDGLEWPPAAEDDDVMEVSR